MEPHPYRPAETPRLALPKPRNRLLLGRASVSPIPDSCGIVSSTRPAAWRHPGQAEWWSHKGMTCRLACADVSRCRRRRESMGLTKGRHGMERCRTTAAQSLDSSRTRRPVCVSNLHSSQNKSLKSLQAPAAASVGNPTECSRHTPLSRLCRVYANANAMRCGAQG